MSEKDAGLTVLNTTCEVKSYMNEKNAGLTVFDTTCEVESYISEEEGFEKPRTVMILERRCL